MLNILITNDDGPEATGLKILQEAVQRCWPGIKPITLTSDKPVLGGSFSCTPGWQVWREAVPTKINDTEFYLPLSPCDLIYRAFMGPPNEFSNRPWDLVLVGVNHGANLGFDIYHSGTCAAAMTAATAFGCASFAFSQDLPDPSMFHNHTPDRKYFDASERIVYDFLTKTSPDGGVCWNVNIPQKAEFGYKPCKVAHYSRYRTPPVELVPRARDEVSDVTAHAEGYVTISELMLRVNPPLQY